MKKIVSILLIVTLFSSCKEEAVEKPDRLIEKEKMVNIMYDLALLEGIKYQNPNSLEDKNINPSEYIYKKYKIDSLQFAKSNVYYASNYNDYKEMFDKITKRIDDRKIVIDSLLKIENKRKVKQDSIKLQKKKSITRDSLLALKKSIIKAKTSEEKVENK